MSSLTPTAQRVSADARIGSVVKVYGPHTVASIIVGLLAIALGLGFTLVSGRMLGSDLVPDGMNPLRDTIDRDSSLLADQQSIARWIPLFGLVFVLVGLIAIISAFANASSRVVLCQNGVAFATRKVRDAFSFAEVESVKRRTIVTTNQTGPNGTTSTTFRYRTVVRTRDGRQFVIDSQLLGGAARKLGKIVDQSVKQFQAGYGRR
jgi:hypothetical protein